MTRIDAIKALRRGAGRNASLGRAIVLVSIAALSLTLATAAKAAPDQLFIFQDGLLYNTSAEEQEQLLDELVSLGVDTLHVQLPWVYLAPHGYSPRKPKGFDGTSPSDYAASGWEPYDRLVRAATARGLKLLFTPMGWFPGWVLWKNPKTASLAPYRKVVKYFGRFVQAIGTRYSGSYQAEDGSGVLPRVSFWSIGNEFNNPGWFIPMWAYSAALGDRIPVSPQVYRKLYLEADRGLRRSGHGQDPLLIGELDPWGSDNGKREGSMRPADFLREFFCLDKRYQPFHGIERKVRGCGHLGKIRTAGLAIHPIPWDYWVSPRHRPKNRSEVSMATMPRLEKLLDRVAARGLIAKGLPIYVTEYWLSTYEAEPETDDRRQLGSLKRQAANINIGEYLAYRDKRVKSFTQYQYADFDDAAGWTSGLRFGDLTPKPAYDAYRLPIFVRCESRDKLRIWGLVRPLNMTPGPRKVQIEAGTDQSFGPVGDSVNVTDPRGYFQTKVTFPKATSYLWRFSWIDASEETYSSRAAVAVNAVTKNGSCKSNEAVPLPPSQDLPPSDSD